MNLAQLMALCESLGVKKLHSTRENIIGCCPVHGESRPSWGVSVFKAGHPWNCYSCGAAGASVVSLVAQVMNLTKQQAIQYTETFGIVEIPDTAVERGVLNITDNELLCYDRLEKYRDLPADVVKMANLRHIGDSTLVPYYWNKKLVGAIVRKDVGAKVLPYKDFVVRDYLYYPRRPPIAKLPLILVEGFYDALKIYSFGWHNVAAISGTAYTEAQVRQTLAVSGPFVVCMFDRDRGGMTALNNVRKKLVDIPVWSAMEYKVGDPGQMTEEDFENALKNRKIVW